MGGTHLEVHGRYSPGGTWAVLTWRYMGGTDLEVHGRGGCGGDELILETDQLPKFRVLLEPVLQTCSKQEQLTVWSSSRLKSAPACGGGGLDVDFNGHFQTVRG